MTVLGTSFDDLTGFAVHLQQLRHVELGLLEDLDFTHMNLMKGVGGRSSFGDVGSDRVREKFGNNLSDIRSLDLQNKFKIFVRMSQVIASKTFYIYLTSHNVHHLLSNDSDLGGLCVGCLFDLVLSLLGESDAEKSELVSVS